MKKTNQSWALLCLSALLISLSIYSFNTDDSRIILDKIEFEANSTDIADVVEASKYLDALAEELQNKMHENPTSIAVIHGHCDKGVTEILGLLRANAIGKELSERGLENLFFVGHGASSAMSQERGAKENRRIEIELVENRGQIEKDQYGFSLIPSAEPIILKNDFKLGYEVNAQFLNKDEDAQLVIITASGDVWSPSIPTGSDESRIKLSYGFDQNLEKSTIELKINGKAYKPYTADGLAKVGFKSGNGQLKMYSFDVKTIKAK